MPRPTPSPFPTPIRLATAIADGETFADQDLADIGAADAEQTLWLVRKKQGALQAVQMGPVRFVPLLSPLLDDPAMCQEMT